jgi:hypothetical protein
MHLVARVEGVMKLDGYTRTVQVQPSRKVSAKTRIRGIGPMVEFESLPGILADWVDNQMTNDMAEPEEQILLADADIQIPEVDMTDEAVEVD